MRGGLLPLLPRHLARFERSRVALGLARPESDLATLLGAPAGTLDAVRRVEVAGGRASCTESAFTPPPPPAVVTVGVPHEPYVHKTTARTCFDAALREAAGAGAADALLLTAEGLVAEGTVWNLFWWEGGRLLTPGLGLGVLAGVARARVLELAGDAVEGSFPRAALDGRSLFLTNAIRGVQPIGSLDGKRVPEDPRTAALAERFWPGDDDAATAR